MSLGATCVVHSTGFDDSKGGLGVLAGFSSVEEGDVVTLIIFTFSSCCLRREHIFFSLGICFFCVFLFPKKHKSTLKIFSLLT